jgi:hypothetical protein
MIRHENQQLGKLVFFGARNYNFQETSSSRYKTLWDSIWWIWYVSHDKKPPHA